MIKPRDKIKIKYSKPLRSSPWKDKRINKDEAWISKNFKWLIDHHPGKYVILSDGEPFIGDNVLELERQAQEKHPGVITTGMPIPRREDLITLL